jgi:hypothetical protein
MKNNLPNTIQVPLALQNLIKANNTLLKTYQAQLMEDVQQANLQMMQLLQIDPANGWRLDMETMKYIRVDEQTTIQVTDPDKFLVES